MIVYGQYDSSINATSNIINEQKKVFRIIELTN